MKESEVVNAIIKSVTITTADHGVLSMWLHLDYGGTSQGFGGYCLYSPTHPDQDSGGWFIHKCMDIAGVSTFEGMVGKIVRVKATHGGVTAIGHVVKDEWFNPGEEWKT